MGQWGEPYKAENGDTLIDHYNTKAFEPIGKNSKVDSTFIINTETKKRVKMTKLELQLSETIIKFGEMQYDTDIALNSLLDFLHIKLGEQKNEFSKNVVCQFDKNKIELYTIGQHPLLGEPRSYASQQKLANIFKEKAEKEGLIATQGDNAYILYLNINELCKLIVSKLAEGIK